MKKTMIFAMAVLLAAGGSYLTFAKERAGGTKDVNSDIMSQKQCCDTAIMCGQAAGACPIHLMMAQSLIQRQIVTPADGGVIIMVGSKLLKYDKNLKFITETELNIDMEKIQRDVRKIMKTCPACRKTQR